MPVNIPEDSNDLLVRNLFSNNQTMLAAINKHTSGNQKFPSKIKLIKTPTKKISKYGNFLCAKVIKITDKKTKGKEK